MIKLLASTCFGLGLLPKAPGTWGSMYPLVIVLVCGYFGVVQPWLTLILICLFAASASATITFAPWYTKKFNSPDPPQVVSDEVAGQSLGLLGMAWAQPTNPTVWILLAVLSFVIFRLLDILKPSIIGKSQQLQGGYGVLIDDVLAGLVTGVIVVIVTLLML